MSLYKKQISNKLTNLLRKRNLKIHTKYKVNNEIAVKFLLSFNLFIIFLVLI